jgi:hypothetical protein
MNFFFFLFFFQKRSHVSRGGQGNKCLGSGVGRGASEHIGIAGDNTSAVQLQRSLLKIGLYPVRCSRAAS